MVPCLLLATATAIATAIPHQRLQRDVSELVPSSNQPAYNYLPPEPKFVAPEDTEITTETVIADTEAPVADTVDAGEAVAAAEPEAMPESGVLGADGYEYRTVRRLKYRQRVRRDVSHLSTKYLPPSQSYLPPSGASDDSEVVSAAQPKVAPVYLPPAQEEVSSEAPIIVEDVETEAPAVEEEGEQPELRTQEGEEEVPQNSALLMDDGYHYKQPAEEMALPKAAEIEYLPPLEQGQTEAEGPEESAVLAKDGYHYRAIKRLRL